MNRIEHGDRLTRRARILDAATEVIAIRGVGASFGAIAQQAGVSPALITYHFRTRKDLLFAVADAVNAEVDQALNLAMTPEQTPGTRLRRFIEGFLDYARQRPQALLTARALVHGIPAEQRQDLPAIAPDRGIASVSDLIAAAQSTGEAAQGSERGMAIALMGALESLAFHIATDQDGGPTHTCGTEVLLRLVGIS